MYGRSDFDFLERVFQKLLMNFTWWINRKDADGKGVFEGGFLGLVSTIYSSVFQTASSSPHLVQIDSSEPSNRANIITKLCSLTPKSWQDNIGLFNQSESLLTGGVLEQADSTGWMAFYCLSMLNIALELSKHRRTYEDIASKFFEHFILISDAMLYRRGDEQASLWNEADGFYYDAISWGGPFAQQLPIRSLVGLIPLFAVLTLEPEFVNRFPSFKRRLHWFIENRHDVAGHNIASLKSRGKDDRMLLSIVNRDRLVLILRRMIDESEFLSQNGIRSLSKYHEKNICLMDVNGQHFQVSYVPSDSDSGLFGGNR